MDEQNKNPNVPTPQSSQPVDLPTNYKLPYLNHERVLQPSQSFVEEIQSINDKKPEAPNPIAISSSPAQTPLESIYPEVTRGLNETSFQPTDNENIQLSEKLPIGIYIVVAFLLAGFVVSLANAHGNISMTLLSLINILLATGLLMKKDIARKILIILASILIILTLIVVVGLFSVQQRAEQSATTAQTAIENVQNNQSSTAAQQQAANNYQNQITSQRNKLNNTYIIAYIQDSIIIVGYTALVIYLTRPKIKSIFG